MYANTWYTVLHHRLEDPPATLYRVEHSGNRNNVFVSRATPPTFQNHNDFVYMKSLHADWSNRVPTPFLSTFVHYNHALNWARHSKRNMGDPLVQIYAIDTNGLVVFGAGGGEYVVFDEISDGNIRQTWVVMKLGHNQYDC